MLLASGASKNFASLAFNVSTSPLTAKTLPLASIGGSEVIVADLMNNCGKALT